MNDRKPTQLTLFSHQWPEWKSLPSHTQESIVDGLSEMLLQTLQQHAGHHDRTATSTSMEKHDVT